MKRITKEHEWVEIEGDVATIGITEYAASELGDITFIELPDVGASLAQGDPFGVVESVKAASDLYAPIGGEVSAVNEQLDESPETVNQSAEKDGWIVKLVNFKAGDLDTLMTEDEYAEYIGS